MPIVERIVVSNSSPGDELDRTSIRPATPTLNIVGDTQFVYQGAFSIPNPSSVTLELVPDGAEIDSWQWYARDIAGDDQAIVGATAATLVIAYNAAYLLSTDTVITCLAKGKWYTSVTVTKKTIDVYRVQISGGVRAISYDQFDTNPVPSANQVFYASLYKNDVVLSTDVTYQWNTGGCFAISGSSTASGVTMQVNANKQAGSTYVQCASTYSGITETERVEIAITRYDATLDWVVEWDDTKEAMYDNDTLVGQQIIGARVVAGTLEIDSPDHTTMKRLSEGFAMGTGLRIKTNEGTQDRSGFYAVKDGKITMRIETDGDAYFGGTLSANALQSATFTVKDNIIVDPSHGYVAGTNESLVDGDTRSYMDQDEFRLQEWRDDHITTTSGTAALDTGGMRYPSIATIDGSNFISVYTTGSLSMRSAIGTLSGDTISWGTFGAIFSNAYYSSVVKLDSTHVAILYYSYSGTIGWVYRIGTWTGSAFTWGAMATLPYSISDIGFAQAISINLDDTHIFFSYSLSSGYQATWNGSILTDFVAIPIVDDRTILALTRVSATKIVALFYDDGTNRNFSYHMLEWNGSTLVASGYENQVISFPVFSASASMLDTEWGLLGYAREAASGSARYFRIMHFEGNSFTFADEEVLQAGTSSRNPGICSIDITDATSVFLCDLGPPDPGYIHQIAVKISTFPDGWIDINKFTNESSSGYSVTYSGIGESRRSLGLHGDILKFQSSPQDGENIYDIFTITPNADEDVVFDLANLNDLLIKRGSTSLVSITASGLLETYKAINSNFVALSLINDQLSSSFFAGVEARLGDKTFPSRYGAICYEGNGSNAFNLKIINNEVTAVGDNGIEFYTGADLVNYKMKINEDGYILVGGTALPSTNPLLYLQGEGVNSELNVRTYKEGVAANSVLRATTIPGTEALPTMTQLDDVLFSIIGQGWNANAAAVANAANISIVADGEWGTGGDTSDSPGRLVFNTTPDGSSALTERMRINSVGQTLIQTTSAFLCGLTSSVPSLSLANLTSNVHAIMTLRCFSSTAAQASVLSLGRSKSATKETLTVTANSDVLGYLTFDGVDAASTFKTAAYIKVSQYGGAGTGYLAGDIEFFTSKDSSSALSSKVIITHSGLTGIGVSNPLSLLDVAGTARFGDSTANYSDFEADGTLHFTGNATVFKDLVMQGLGLTKGGAADPGIENFVDANCKQYAFDGAATAERLYSNIEMDHDYKQGTDIELHIHWNPTTTGAGQVTWNIYATWANNLSVFPTPVLIKGTSVASGVSWVNTYKNMGYLPGTGTFTSAGSYNDEANRDTSLTMYLGGSPNRLGQSFLNAVAGDLFSCSFLLSKTGSPTGNAYVVLYVTSSSKPIGAVLATSDTLDVSTLTTTQGWVNFYFPPAQQYALSAATTYFLVLLWDGGDGSNYISMHCDGSTPGFANGNIATRAGTTWTADANKDAIFDVYTVTNLVDKTINSQFGLQLYRDPTVASDTYGDDAGLICLGIHYEADTIGSRSIRTK